MLQIVIVTKPAIDYTKIWQVLLTWHITNSANEWRILNSSLTEVFMILLSYHRFVCACDLSEITQVVVPEFFNTTKTCPAS